MAMQSINPATGELMGEWQETSPAEVDRCLSRASQAFRSWRKTPMEQRAEFIKQAAKVLRQGKSHYAGLITAEMGKPIVEAEAEVEKCAWCCDYFAENAARFLAEVPAPSSATESYVGFDPLGTVLAIMPWNFPFWQVFRFAAPALMAGNTVVLKHASNVPQCALAIEEVFTRASVPPGTFQTLLVSGNKVSSLIEDSRIAAVTLTGSDIAGAKVAEVSGKVLKKTVLELGGSDPFIVLDDADLDAAVKTAVNARYQNTGQSCIAAKRFIVTEGIAGRFRDAFVAEVEQLRVGDPAERETQVGPVARDDLRDGLEDQVQRSIAQGARLLTGGHRLERQGFFYAPTVLDGVRPGMPAFDEETFGPVAAIIEARDAAEAIRLANHSQFGLGSALWTADIDRAKKLARQIEAGSVFINGMVASDPRLPFGGVKRSGYGRELSEFGIREFVNVKTVWIGPRRDN